MNDIISKELFDHLVVLAALELPPQEAEYLRQQLNNQLKAINELAAIPLNPSTPPALHGISYANDIKPPLRKDDWIPYDSVDDILNQAPELEERYIIVPDIPHQELE